MTYLKHLYLVSIGLLLFSCNGTTQVTIKDIKLTEVKNDSIKEPPIPPAPTRLKVAGYLVYKDSTISSFDVLNDKTIALWNTIIGGGDAEKPSEKTKIVVTGKLDGLSITIYNDKRKVVHQKLPNFSGDFEFIINETGCYDVKVIVTKLNKVIYQNKIPYRCGE